MNSRLLSAYCPLDSDAMAILRNAMTRFDMSARAYDRILRVARTIADLEASSFPASPVSDPSSPELCPPITAAHIAEAVGYRNLDRASWGLR